MKYGYARVSSLEQDLTAQINALKENWCEKIFKEKVSGRDINKRTQFQLLIETVNKGDSIVVTKLDRFARSAKDALNTIELLNQKSVSLIVLNLGGQTVDTTSTYGKFMLTVFSAISELEADMIRERQRDGIILGKLRGVYRGRPKRYTNANKRLQHALELFRDRDTNKMTVNDIADVTQVSRATIYRAVRENANEK
ncbi:recombinase family protein [Desulfosporosinus metallidurans]|uniref:Resolvase/integrase Bin n=1 Tax=Desulfosporosinus metallidurans TaxID=1888891 RepID=A0A1Q8QFX6_9FIRM|nr:recombinase family protein [Desulfosporosinus metallidurans]OLN26249.1 Resolvase/integrase Bin [Desulfosporosinus metallidurans]